MIVDWNLLFPMKRSRCLREQDEVVGYFTSYDSFLVKHSISEKKRVVRFNTCIDEFIDMLNVRVANCESSQEEWSFCPKK